MTRLILVRHGETDWTKEKKYQGNSDIHLSGKGIEQAKQVAQNQGGEVVVHGRDGRIKSKDSYGNDPNPPKDKEH